MLDWGKVDPSKLRKSFREDVESVLNPSPYRYRVQYGFRSVSEQADLYAKHLAGGPLAAPPGQSAHNYGLAIDVVVDASDRPGLQADWDVTTPAWVWLTETIAKHPRLKTGAKYKDYGHIERLNWSTHKDD